MQVCVTPLQRTHYRWDLAICRSLYVSVSPLRLTHPLALVCKILLLIMIQGKTIVIVCVGGGGGKTACKSGYQLE